ncbi:HYR-like domain-containing protein, partial [Paucihalobacter sp.]|uniref:HYR-like domain-containing protein n=1 Tax=Paucihalobacter sp. TaxID=2850405 RepID=UPI002FE0EA26
IVDDSIAPVPDVATLPDATGECSATATAPTATDNCSGAITATTTDPVTYSTQGSYSITWIYDDANGNTTTQTQTVIVDDVTAPVPDVATLPNATGECSVTVTAPTATDNCSGAITATTTDPSTYNTQGTYTITWTYDDGNGNTSTQTQTVIVDDTSNPVTPTLATITGECSATATAPTTTDNCSGTITGTTTDSLTYNVQGTYTINWVFDDGNGNSITVPQTVIVDDVTAPAPDVATLPNATGECSVTVTAPTATDNCSGAITATTTDPSTYNTQGTYTITWTYDDGNGNTSTQAQTVIVDDITAPVPDVANLPNATGECSVTVTAPTATDNCSGAITATTTDPVTYNTQGTYTINWTYNDGNGNTSTQAQTVIVDDVTAPNAICQDISVTLDATGSATINPSQINNGSFDNCGISAITLDNTSFDCGDLRTNTVTLAVRDFANNVSTCTATITVLDPAASATVSIVSDDADNEICEGENLTFTATPVDGGTSPIYEWFIDGISFGTNSPTFTPFTTLSVGTYEVYVRMRSSLSACVLPKQSNSIFVTVNPLPVVTSPVAICIDDTGTLTPNSGGTWVSNNTGVATVTNSGVITPVSPGTVTFTFTNSNGCFTTTDVVSINALPVLTAPVTVCVDANETLLPNSGGNWISNNPAIATVTSTGLITGVAPGNVTFTFTDTNGCSAISNSVEILDIPTITSVTVSDDPVCSGDPSILTVNVPGVGGTVATLVNYNFNNGNNYGALNGQEIPGITSSFSGTLPFNRPNSGVVTTPLAFTQNNTAGGALRQIDNRFSFDSGTWNITIGGANLNSYQDFRIYFQTRRVQRRGNNKNIIVEYRLNGAGGFTQIATVPLNNNSTAWQQVLFSLPATANNATQIQIRLNVSDGYFWGVNNNGPDVLLDNFQIQGSTSGESLLYSWTANTGANAGLASGAMVPSVSNNQITVNPQVTSNYTVTVTNSDGCSETETVTVNVFPTPAITINADYCPIDDPNTPQDESLMVQLVASANQSIVSWLWETGETTNTIYVDIAGTYQVLGTTANGCAGSAIMAVAQELVVDGDFTNFDPTNPSFFTEYTQNQNFYTGVNTSGLWPEGYYAVNESAHSPTNGVGYHPAFHGRDHTNNTVGPRNFMMVNGGALIGNPPREPIIWQQTVPVEPNTEYYFSAWAMNLNPASPARLQFEVNGVLVGTVADLSSAPTPTIEAQVNLSNWVRFYSNPTWNSGAATTAVIRIRNLNTDLGGNDFGLDDISFASLSTFITLTSAIGTNGQTVCQDSPITDITYDIGGGLTPPNIQWELNGSPLAPNTLPVGLTDNFNGLAYVITGTPSVPGNYTYIIETSSSCDIKSANGTLTVDLAPVTSINTSNSPLCYSEGFVDLTASIGGSALSGSWSGGIGFFNNISGDGSSARYNFGGNESGIVTLTFTSNNPAGPCDSAVSTIDIEIIPYIIANAGIDIDNSGNSCDDLSVALSANNVNGQWSVISGQIPSSYNFSDPTAYNSSFSGESGETYLLQWEAINASPCANATDTITVTFADCGSNLVFDGVDDYISLADNFDLNGTPFSIEAWIKPNTITGTQTIISKPWGKRTLIILT